MFDRATLRELWYRALELEFGVGVQIKPEDRKSFVAAIYEARTETADDSLDRVIVILPKDENWVWLCKKEVSLD